MSPRVLLVTLTTLASAGSLPAAIWSSPGWALSSDVNAILAYDSNLDNRSDGRSSFLSKVEPSLTLRRRNSSSQIELTADMGATFFEVKGLGTETGGGLYLKYSYPYSGETNIRPERSASLRWARYTVADSFLNLRVPLDVYNLTLQKRLLYTGKLGVNLSLAAHRYKYNKDGLDTNDDVSLTGSIGYDYSPFTVYSINFTPKYAQSQPNNTVGSTVKSKEFGVSARVDGELLPKLKGFTYLGASGIKYTYTTAKDETDLFPVAGAGLTWGVTPKGTVGINGEMGAGFSPRGDASKSQKIQVSFSQSIYEAWSGTVYLGASRYNYPNSTLGRKDNSKSFGASLDYRPSDQFSVSADYTYVKQTTSANQTSVFSASNYDRHFFGVTVSGHF